MATSELCAGCVEQDGETPHIDDCAAEVARVVEARALWYHPGFGPAICEWCDAPIGECELDCQQRRETWGD